MKNIIRPFNIISSLLFSVVIMFMSLAFVLLREAVVNRGIELPSRPFGFFGPVGSSVEKHVVYT